MLSYISKPLRRPKDGLNAIARSSSKEDEGKGIKF